MLKNSPYSALLENRSSVPSTHVGPPVTQAPGDLTQCFGIFWHFNTCVLLSLQHLCKRIENSASGHSALHKRSKKEYARVYVLKTFLAPRQPSGWRALHCHVTPGDFWGQCRPCAQLSFYSCLCIRAQKLPHDTTNSQQEAPQAEPNGHVMWGVSILSGNSAQHLGKLTNLEAPAPFLLGFEEG